MWKIIRFITPLMFIVFIQKISRPVINLIVAKTSPSTDKAAQVKRHISAVLTCYKQPLNTTGTGCTNCILPTGQPSLWLVELTQTHRACFSTSEFQCLFATFASCVIMIGSLQKKADGSRPNIASKKIALFCIICFGVSATVSSITLLLAFCTYYCSVLALLEQIHYLLLY